MKNKNLNIFIVSLLMLFLEMFIVRWISTEIRIFAYISNLALLACFIGIGIGCYYAKGQVNIRNSLFALCFLILASKSIPFRNITDMLSGFTDFDIWFENLSPYKFIPAIEGIALTICLFSGITILFFPLGQILGNLLDTHKNIIVAYSLNIAASILGIWLFAGFSFLSTPPYVWLLLSLTGYMWFYFHYKHSRASFYLPCLLSILLMVTPINTSALLTRWSPYQRLDLWPNMIAHNTQNGYVITVNNVSYMCLLDLSPEFIEKYPNIYNISMRRFNQYEIPFMLRKGIKDVLIVGAGAGNDVAGALRNGIAHIDAVEIDPDIYLLGKIFHPEKPYQDQRVNIIIDDGRSFFKKCKKKYDVITFGLADSHTLSSSYNNLRLDHYLYTIESFKEAKKLLNKDGILTVIFDAKRDWIAKRIYDVLKTVFGMEPITFVVNSPAGIFGWGGIMYVVGDNIKEGINGNKELKEFIDNNKIVFGKIDTPLTTDDWPYLYLKNKSIPILYLCIMLSLLILLFIVGTKTLLYPSGKLNLHFFFLGMAFLLLEFQNISKSCLLFGSTWLVNAYIISAILFLILLANILVYYIKRINIKICYLSLFLSIVILYLLPLRIFNNLGYLTKGISISIFMNIPVLFAGIIFIQSFSKTQEKSLAFGSNLLGASIGGLLESISFITGIKSLLVLVLIFYLLSYLSMKYRQGCS